MRVQYGMGLSMYKPTKTFTRLFTILLVDNTFPRAFAQNSGTVKAPMNEPRAAFGTATVNGKIYVNGGNNNAGHVIAPANITRMNPI